MVTRKMERVQRELQRRLASLVLSELKDPRLDLPMAITDCRISPDLQILKVYFSVDAAPERQREVMDVLERAKGRLRRLLGDGLELRNIPELRFFLDETAEKAGRIEAILDELGREKQE